MNTRLVANGFLVVATVGSVATFNMGGIIHHGFLAAMIGGCADWFAVTALFHKPFGISYRTEILKRNRKRLMDALVEYISTDLLSAENIIEDFSKLDLRIQIPVPKDIAKSVIDKSFEHADRKVALNIPPEIVDSTLKSERVRKILLESISRFRSDYIRNGPPLRKNILDMLGSDEDVLKLIGDFLSKTAQEKISSSRFEFTLAPEQLDLIKTKLLDEQADDLKVDVDIKSMLKTIVEKYHGELGRYLTNYLDSYSDEDLTTLIEGKVNDDLQMIRINGAIVGGLAGAGLYLVSHFFEVGLTHFISG